MDTNIAEYSYANTSIEAYFTEGYDLEFNHKIIKELTECSSKVVVSDRAIVFNRIVPVGHVSKDGRIKEIESVDSVISKVVRFSALSFFNLFYHEVDFIKNTNISPLSVIPRLREIPLDFFDRLYFLERLGMVLMKCHDKERFVFVANRIQEEYLSVWSSFLGIVSVIEMGLISDEEKEKIAEKIKTLPSDKERLNYLVGVKHYIINLENKTNKDLEFLQTIESQADYYKEIIQLGVDIDGNRNVDAPSSKKNTINSFCPIINPEYLELVYVVLKKYFNQEQHVKLLKLLNTGQDSDEKLQFLDNGNRLADAFKQLYEVDIITGCQKRDLEEWICRNFEYLSNHKTKSYNTKYLNNIVSTNKFLCKNALISLKKDKSTGKYSIM